MVLFFVLLAWPASFARRLCPPGARFHGVRTLLVLDRPG
jgi:anti-anti-sigma factor